MTGLVICRNLLFLIRNYPALFLRADTDLYKGAFDIFLTDKAALFFCRHNGRLIQQIFQIGAGKARCSLRHLF